MTTPNNMHGHTKGIDWKEVYKEELEPGLYIVIVRSYEKAYEGNPNASGSSHICVQVVVTNGKMYTWSSGIVEYEGESAAQDPKLPLRTLTSKQGWPVYQKKIFGDHVAWVVEVPMEEMLKMMKG